MLEPPGGPETANYSIFGPPGFPETVKRCMCGPFGAPETVVKYSVLGPPGAPETVKYDILEPPGAPDTEIKDLSVPRKKGAPGSARPLDAGSPVMHHPSARVGVAISLRSPRYVATSVM